LAAQVYNKLYKITVNYLVHLVAICSLAILFCYYNAFASSNNELNSPYISVNNHLYNLQKDNYFPEKAKQSIKFDKGVSKRKQIELAVKLKRIFDGSGIVIKIDNLPRDNNYIDSITKKNVFVVSNRYPDIYLTKYGNQWQYSIETSQMIEILHDELYPIAVDEYVAMMPDFVQNEFLGLMVWQYFAIVIFLIIGAILFVFFSQLTGRLLIYVIHKFNKGFIADIFIKDAAKPSSILIVCQLFIYILPALELPLTLNVWILAFMKIFVPLNVVYILMKLVNLIAYIFAKLAQKTESTVDDHLVPFFRKALKGLVAILGVFYILQLFDINITPLIAGASIGGLALALAAQDTIKNIFGSFTIFTDQPFNVGDWIIFDGGEGTVEEVGVRSTRIRTFANSLIAIPNGRLGDMTINNMGKRNIRRFSTNISITFDTPADLIQAFTEGLRRIVDEHPDTTKENYHIYLNNFGESSFQILFYIFFNVKDWSNELRARHEIIIDIIKLAESLNLRFAFPTHTLHVEDFPEKKSMSPKYIGNIENFRNISNEYFISKSKLSKD